MAYSFEFHPAAESELVEAAEWYRERSESAAQRFALEIESKISLISENPESWAAFEAGTRRILLNGFPYNLIYRVSSDLIFVVAVMHQKRKPGYWGNR